MDTMVKKPVTRKSQTTFAALNNKHKGKQLEVSVAKLVIPDQGEFGYQREEVSGHPFRIACDFDWRLFGVVEVVKRLDLNGILQVADGGNRVRAVRLRGDIDEVPCIIHDAKSNEEAAAIFTGININRRAISFRPLHKAMLLAQDEHHLLAQAAWDKLNSNTVIFEPMKPLVKFCRKQKEYEALMRIIPVLKELSFTSPKERITADFFKGLVTLEIAIAPNSLSEPKWVKKMKTLGLRLLTDFAGVSAYTGRHPSLFAKILAGNQRLNYRPNPFQEKKVG